MKILVTGANGQLGSELRELADRFSLWNFLFTDIEELDIRSEFQTEKYIDSHSPDFIINCAAYTAVDNAEKDHDAAMKVNALAPSLLARAAAGTGAGFIHISTDYVFSGESFVPYSEDDKTDPQTVYGNTKLEGEHLCLSNNPESVIIRTSWLYSSFGNNFVRTMLRLGEQQTSLKVVFDQTGTPTYAADLAGAVLSIVGKYENNRDKYIPGIYNFSNEGVTTWYDFARTIFELSGTKCNVLPVLSDEFPTPAKRPHYSVLNKSKIKITFGLDIPYWKDSLKICLEKLKK